MKRMMQNGLLALSASLLVACASSSPDVIQRGDVQRLSQVQDGVVLSVRNVVVDGSQSGAAGNAIERMATREDAVEVLVQLKGGERRAVVQARGEQTLTPGDAVILVTTGGKVRITKAPR